MKFLMVWRFVQYTIKPLIKDRLAWIKYAGTGLGCGKRQGVVEKLFWDFDGKTIALPQVRKNYPYEGFVEWHRNAF